MKKNIQEYSKVFHQNTEFFSTCAPDLIEEKLLNHLKEHGAKGITIN